jgi:hypothetical protein
VDNVSALKQDIQNAVDRIKSLPDEVIDLPKVVDMKSSLRSILKIKIPRLQSEKIPDKSNDKQTYLISIKIQLYMQTIIFSSIFIFIK